MIWVTSDLHLQHDKQFIFQPRGFKTVDEMNETQLKNINDLVKPEDTLYILGDLVLGGANADLSIIKRINCKNIKMIIGNHDTNPRVEWYRNNGIEVLGYADILKYDGYSFYLCHFPTMRTHICEAPLKKKVINLFGHTHQKEKFYGDNPWMYCVCLDCQDNKPVSIEQIIKDCKEQWEKCKEQL